MSSLLQSEKQPKNSRDYIKRVQHLNIALPEEALKQRMQHTGFTSRRVYLGYHTVSPVSHQMLLLPLSHQMTDDTHFPRAVSNTITSELLETCGTGATRVNTEQAEGLHDRCGRRERLDWAERRRCSAAETLI